MVQDEGCPQTTYFQFLLPIGTLIICQTFQILSLIYPFPNIHPTMVGHGMGALSCKDHKAKTKAPKDQEDL